MLNYTMNNNKIRKFSKKFIFVYLSKFELSPTGLGENKKGIGV